MRVKMILPALTEAKSRYFRPIKYSLFPPLGLATLAGHLPMDDEVEIVDEHVQPLDCDDRPDIVAIEVYITSARRSYEIADHYRARGVHVCLGGLHVTSLPEEAERHADTVFLGPGDDSWSIFLRDYRAGLPAKRYHSAIRRLDEIPPVRRDLIQRARYFVPNSLVVSRGCPHHCDFCYKDSFFAGGKTYYTLAVERALQEIEALPGRHLYFLDDHLFGDRRFASALFDGMIGAGRVWQAAATVASVFDDELLAKAVDSGLRSLFVGFETLNADNLAEQNKWQNRHRNYREAVRRLHDCGVMINASFVFGMDADDRDVFMRTVDWAVAQGIETATFHILTPYPGTALWRKLNEQGRITTTNWDLYDTRHCVFEPFNLTATELEAGYWKAYEQFYGWSNIWSSANTETRWIGKLRHLAYTGAWKKFEWCWGLLIHTGLLGAARPLLETVLDGHENRASVAELTLRKCPAPDSSVSGRDAL